MHQFAWLQQFAGMWLLLDDNFKYPARTWIDKTVALTELRKEGWIIKPHRKRSSRLDSQKQLLGYAMVRTIH